MNAQQIVDSLLGDEDVAAIAQKAINAPYAYLHTAYLRELSRSKDPRRAWEEAFGDGFMKRGQAAKIAAFNVSQAIAEIRNLGLNRVPRQVELYMEHVIGAAVEMLNLRPAQVEAVRLLFKKLALE